MITLDGALGVASKILFKDQRDEVNQPFYDVVRKSAIPPPKWYYRQHSKISNLRLRFV